MSDDENGPSPRTAAMALVLIVAMVLGGLWLARELRSNAALQDCVMAGRTNCAPIRP